MEISVSLYAFTAPSSTLGDLTCFTKTKEILRFVWTNGEIYSIDMQGHFSQAVANQCHPVCLVKFCC